MRDESLETAFARRDAEGYERAYERFASRMYTTALRVLRDRDLARECVHDVLLHLWRKGNAYSPARGNLEAFLVVCTRNAALQRVRDDTRRREVLASSDPPQQAIFDPDPFEHAQVTSALSELTNAQAETVRLAYYQGLTHTQIAARLNEPVGTIKSRISSALRALRKRLVEEAHDG